MTQTQIDPPVSPPGSSSSLVFPDPDPWNDADTIVTGTDPDWDSGDIGSLDGSETARSYGSLSFSNVQRDHIPHGKPSISPKSLNQGLGTTTVIQATKHGVTPVDAEHQRTLKQHIIAAASLVSASTANGWHKLLTFSTGILNSMIEWLDGAQTTASKAVIASAKWSEDASVAAAYILIYTLFIASTVVYGGVAYSTKQLKAASAHPMTRSLAIGVLMSCLVYYSQDSVTTTQTFRSIACRVPSLLAARGSNYDCPKPVVTGNYIPLVNYQIATVERVLGSVADNKKIALALTRNADATADLNQVLIHSSILVRHELSERITEFVTRDRGLVISVAEFDSKVSSTVKALVAINGYTLQTAKDKYEASKSLYNKALSVVSSAGSESQLTMKVYKEVAETSRAHITALVKDAYSLLEIVNNQSNDLDLIKGFLVVGENEVTKGMKDQEGLAGLWKALANHKVDPEIYEKNLEILKNLSNAYKIARAHPSFVTSTLRENALELQGADDQARYPLMLKDINAADAGRHLQLLSDSLSDLNTRREQAFQRIGMAEALGHLLE